MIDGELEARMQMAQDVTSMVLALRRKVNIKVRQPLQCIMVPVVDEEQKMHIEAVKDLIMSEVNVKEIKFVDGAAGVLVKKVKCDFKKTRPEIRQTDESCRRSRSRNVAGSYCRIGEKW